MRDVTDLPDRMVSKIRVEKVTDRVPGPCWIWTGCLNSKGYGCTSFGGKRYLTHRVAYMEQHKGEIPAGLQIDHLCRTRACCNPDHLEAVTGKVNCERASNATKMRCVNGHALAGKNLVLKKRSGTDRWMRNCRICQLDSQQRSRLKRGESTRLRSVAKKRAELVAESEAALKLLRPEPAAPPVAIPAPLPEQLELIDEYEILGQQAAEKLGRRFDRIVALRSA